MKKFIVKEYTFTTSKMERGKKPLTFLMVSDLHNVILGNQNREIFQEIEEINPDVILIVGDMIIGMPDAPFTQGLEFVKTLAKNHPVYYELGNHEHRMKINPKKYHCAYQLYAAQLKKCGVTFLENQSKTIKIRGTKVTIYGLELSQKYYMRRHTEELKREDMVKLIGEPKEDAYQILLAHTPKFAKTYFEWGADLTLSGHYHGGLMRLPFINGVISPYYTFFPKYCYGLYQEGKKRLVVGSGLGEHTIPLRIHNPRELLILRVLPEESKLPKE